MCVCVCDSAEKSDISTDINISYDPQNKNYNNKY
jgi:hypothetical protein